MHNRGLTNQKTCCIIARVKGKGVFELQGFRGAFLAYHKDVKTKVIDEIFDMISDRSGLISELIGMYQECVDSLFDEPEEGNVSWKKS